MRPEDLSEKLELIEENMDRFLESESIQNIMTAPVAEKAPKATKAAYKWNIDEVIKRQAYLDTVPKNASSVYSEVDMNKHDDIINSYSGSNPKRYNEIYSNEKSRWENYANFNNENPNAFPESLLEDTYDIDSANLDILESGRVRDTKSILADVGYTPRKDWEKDLDRYKYKNTAMQNLAEQKLLQVGILRDEMVNKVVTGLNQISMFRDDEEGEV